LDARADWKPCNDAASAKEEIMATEKKHGNREAKKLKKPVPKTIEAAPPTKDMVGSAIRAANKN
jgi:hypothetical protein